MSEQLIAFEGPLGTLRGVLHRPGRKPAPAVMLLHGFTGQHIEDQRLFVQAARQLTDAGFAVLRFDFYGSGNSDGDFEEMTVHTEVADARAGLDWLCAQRGIATDRIGVVGLSLGGAVTVLLAASDPRVRAIVLWNAVAQPALHFTEIARRGRNAGVVGGLRVGAAFCKTFWGLDLVGALRDYAGPGLVITGSADDVVSPSEGELFAAALGERGTLHSIRGAGHTFQHPAWRTELFRVTGDWLRAHV